MDILENFEAQSTALVLNHLQAAIISNSPLAPSELEDLARMDAAVERCAEALVAARRVNLLIVHVRIAFSPGYPEASRTSPMMRYMAKECVLLEGDPGTEFDSRVSPAINENVVTNHAVSAFAGTSIDQLFRVQGINTVILGGLVTHYAVEGTARDAHDRGYRVVVLEDGCSSGGTARHDASITNLAFLSDVVTTGALTATLK
jgi:nicotinamidase-related amidase